MTRVFMNGQEISKEELKNYTAVFDQTGKRFLGLRRMEKGGDDCEEILDPGNRTDHRAAV